MTFGYFGYFHDYNSSVKSLRLYCNCKRFGRNCILLPFTALKKDISHIKRNSFFHYFIHSLISRTIRSLLSSILVKKMQLYLSILKTMW